MAAAASCAVLVPSGNWRTSIVSPRSAAAAITRRTLGWNSVSVIGNRSNPAAEAGTASSSGTKAA